MVQLILGLLFNIQQIISNSAVENGCMVKLIVTNTKEIGHFFNSFASDWVRCCFELHHGIFLLIILVKTRYNEPLYNEVLGITNDFLYSSYSKIYEKNPRYNENLPYNEQILPVP